jgi:VanZ family protein
MSDAPPRGPGRYRGTLGVWLVLIAYASLYPFWPLRGTSLEAVAAMFARPRYSVLYDVVWNVLAYMPLGFFLRLHLGEWKDAHPNVRAVVIAAAWSLAMETCQLFLPNRVASIYDVASNTAGAAVGAAVFFEPFHSTVTRPLAEARGEALIGGARGDAGLMLVVLWLLAQLNPALPFFGAGNLVENGAAAAASDAAAVVPWVAVALSICGFGLFISTLLRTREGSLRATLALLSVALWLKFLGASLVLQPHFSEEWVSGGRVLGLAAGLLLFIPLRRLPRAGRVYLAIVMLMAGDLLSKIFGAYSSLDDFLRLFRWPHGQLASFATLTRFIHELWPLAALVFLIALFLHERRTVARARMAAFPPEPTP